MQGYAQEGTIPYYAGLMALTMSPTYIGKPSSSKGSGKPADKAKRRAQKAARKKNRH